jgi:hypothetical protein
MGLPKLSNIPGAHLAAEVAKQAVAPVLTPFNELKNIVTNSGSFGAFISEATGGNEILGEIGEHAHHTTKHLLGAAASAPKKIFNRLTGRNGKHDEEEVVEAVDEGDTKIEDLLQRGLFGMEGTLGAVAREIQKLTEVTEGMATNAAKQRLEFHRRSQIEDDNAAALRDASEDNADAINRLAGKSEKPKGDDDEGILGLMKGTIGLLFRGIGAISGLLFSIIPRLGIGGVIVGGIVSAFLVAKDALTGMDMAEQWGVSKVSGAIGAAIGGTGKGLVNAFAQAGKWALIGGTTGFLVGGPIGTIVGGVLGAAIGGIAGYFGGQRLGQAIDNLGDWAYDHTVKPIKRVYGDIVENINRLVTAVTPEWILDLINGNDPFTGKDFSLSTVIKECVGKIGEVVSGFIGNMVDGLKDFIVDFLIDKGAVGRSIAKHLMSDEEYKTKVVGKQIEDLKKEIDDSTTSLENMKKQFNTDNDQYKLTGSDSDRDDTTMDSAQIALLMSKLEKLKAEKEQLSPSPDISPAVKTQMRGVNISQQQDTLSEAESKNKTAPIIVAAPSNQTITNQTNNSAVVMPRPIRNNETSFERFNTD